MLTYEVLIPEIRKALIAYSSGKVTQPLRAVLTVPGKRGRYAAMSAVYGNVMGTKLVSIYPENGLANLPTHSSAIHLFSAETGQSMAIMDGDVITEMRTAAVSAIAMETLAPRDASTLAILGAGVQARAHATALRGVCHFDEIYVWNRNQARAERLAAEIGAKVASLDQAVRSADVIVAATSTSAAIVNGRWLKERSLLISVGAIGPTVRELDDEAMQGTLIAESRESVLNESGDVMLSGATVYAELGELLSGAKPVPNPGRIVFKSVGIAVEDMAAASLVYNLLSGALTPNSVPTTRPPAMEA